jgi:hypothetical protein
MHPVVRAILLVFVFIGTAVAWAALGGVMEVRTGDARSELHGKVAELWGREHQQAAPSVVFHWQTERQETSVEVTDGVSRTVTKRVVDRHQEPRSLASTDATVDLHLDPRRKGLLWYALYDVDFAGDWTYRHEGQLAGTARIEFAFPDTSGIYDGFRLLVNGQDHSGLSPQHGRIVVDVPVRPGDEITIAAGYRSRGMDAWSYAPSPDVASLSDFRVAMTTDFTDIDFPPFVMSPSSRERSGEGWALTWAFDQVVTGHNVGMVMPQRIQPGPLAAAMTFSAPISWFFFLLLIEALAMLRGLRIHPVNYAFLGGAFFAFHLVFGYTADHLPVEAAFALAAAISIALVVSYLRLVVSPRFAVLHAGAAQAVYLVGFSLAHFFDGYTGLTVTVLSVGTLFLLMQMTGRLDWDQVLARKPAAPVPA